MKILVSVTLSISRSQHVKVDLIIHLGNWERKKGKGEENKEEKISWRS